MPRSEKPRSGYRSSRPPAGGAPGVQEVGGLPRVLTFDVSEQTVFRLPGEAEAGSPRLAGARGSASVALLAHAEPQTEVLPVWKADCGELWFRGQLVKKFKQAAESQRAILDAFGEQNWTQAIDDPLTGKGDMDRKKRLENAVQGLNSHLRNPLVSFHVINAGEGIEWRIRA
jgi:hypothetical protein